MNKTIGALLVFFIFIAGYRGIAQSNMRQVNDRIETVRQFALDLRNGRSDQEVFKTYLASGGMSSDQTVTQSASDWTRMLRESLQKVKVSEVEVYRYPDHPEKGKALKSIDDPGDENTEELPLEFELHTKDKTLSIDMNDLYVLKLNDEKFYVLFGAKNRIIAFLGLRWGHKVVLMQF